MTILVHRQGNNFGPFSVDQANLLLREGRLLSQDLAWLEGTPAWVRLAAVPGIVIEPPRVPPLPNLPSPPRPTPAPVHPETAGYPLAPGEQTSHRLILVAFLLAFLLGPLGVHRFYTGRIGSGVAMLLLTLTGIGLLISGIWWLIDWIVILCGSFRDAEDRRLTRWV